MSNNLLKIDSSGVSLGNLRNILDQLLSVATFHVNVTSRQNLFKVEKRRQGNGVLQTYVETSPISEALLLPVCNSQKIVWSKNVHSS